MTITFPYTNKTLILFCCFISILALTACSKEKEDPFSFDTTFTSFENNSLQAYVGGFGSTTVVFESGLGVDGTTWFLNDIFATIGKSNQVIAYNRSGYSPSTYGGDARGLENMANDLHLIITEHAQNNQVILVGHSLGGSISRYYAIQHPEKVKAILFIDTNHEEYHVQKAITQEQEDELVQLLEAENNTGGALEAAQLIENLAILQNLPSLPNIPVIALTSVKLENGLTAEDRADWSAAHETLGTGISDFTHIETNQSGHFIYISEPELVINSILELKNK